MKLMNVLDYVCRVTEAVAKVVSVQSLNTRVLVVDIGAYNVLFKPLHFPVQTLFQRTHNMKTS